MNIEEKVHQLIINTGYGINEEVALARNPNSRLEEDLDMDDLDQVELLIELEKTFNVTIYDADFHACNTVQDIINLIKKLSS